MPSHRTDAEREALTIAVLEAPIEMSHGALGKRVGLHRDTVRQIRYGIINAAVAVHLPRMEPGTLARLCTDCVHFTRHVVRSHRQGEHVGECDMGFIEAEDLNYARGCGAFWSAASTTPAVARSTK
jgi:hypothetical protein